MADPNFDPDCIFCKIIQGTIPSARVLETEMAVAFLDINPINPGHVLLVPRTHHAHLGELPEAVAAHAGALLPGLCRAVAAVTGAPGFNVVMNNGRVAGQTVGHGHWHIIPRFDGDPVHWPWPQGRYSGDEIQDMQSRLEAELGKMPNSRS